MEDDRADNEEDMFESGVTIVTLLAVADLLVVYLSTSGVVKLTTVISSVGGSTKLHLMVECSYSEIAF